MMLKCIKKIKKYVLNIPLKIDLLYDLNLFVLVLFLKIYSDIFVCLVLKLGGGIILNIYFGLFF